MSQLYINVGPEPNDGLGDPIRTAFTKTNTNFSTLFSIPQSSPPPTLIGSPGDFAGMYAYSASYFYYCFGAYDGVSTIWSQIEQAGNISATQIVNGNSSVTIPSTSGNVAVNITGTSNVAVFGNTGIYINGVVSATGNVRGGNINTAGNVTGNYIL